MRRSSRLNVPRPSNPASILGIALLLLAAACGGGGEEGADGGGAQAEGDGSIVFWSTENLPDRVAATQEIVDRFTQESGIEVELVPIAEDELANLMVANAASGDLPDVVYHGLEFAAGWSAQGLIDPEAAAAVVDDLGVDTFAAGAVELATVDDQVVTVPSDGWGQLLVYRADLFEQAGLEAPETYDAIRTAAETLADPAQNRVGITLATDPADVFTQQTFEHLALANGCMLTDDSGEVALGSPACVEAIEFYAQLVNDFSPGGAQTVDTTRATYFAGQAAMVIWSPFILDEMAGLRNDALPTCPECGDDPAYLAQNSGLVGAFSGPSGTPAQYGQVSYFGITADADTASAQEFVRFLLDDGYLDWLGIAPEGKFPMRLGTADDPEQFVSGWQDLEAGVDTKAPLSDFYGEQIVDTLQQGVESFDRWGYGHGSGELVTSLYETLVVPQTLNDVLQGSLSPQEAAAELASEASG